MDSGLSYIPYKETGCFSKLVTDYIDGNEALRPFYPFSPTKAGIEHSIEERRKFPVNRQLLTSSLRQQYAHINLHAKVDENIRLLGEENTFTVCTAHQPNLLTGYLYFIYKILHAIKLAQELNLAQPDKRFVPVYYMGSEDNDIEELGKFKFRGETFVWDGDGQKGAVGRMSTKGLKPLLNRLFKLLGPPGAHCDRLTELFTHAYFQHNTVANATQYLVNELFGRYGLIVLNPDDATLKASFIPVLQDELLHQNANPIITQQIEQLGVQYKIQAHPRAINLFYLTEKLRERIERKGDNWAVVNTDIVWTQQQITHELQEHPERFSPNVMLRGLYQETILPNVAFIGGGAEVAYWMQLSALFTHYKIFFPCIFLRQSVLYIDDTSLRLQQQSGFSNHDLFMETEALYRTYLQRNNIHDWQTIEEAKKIADIFISLKEKATAIDATLSASAGAVLTKINHQLTILEQKMLRAEKRKQQVVMNRILKLKTTLFPDNSLQERVDNFSENYLQYGDAFFDTVLSGIAVYTAQFLIISSHNKS